MFKTLFLLSLATSTTSALRHTPFVPIDVPPPVPIIGNDSRVWSSGEVNRCNLCRVISSFIEAHEDVICAKDDKKCSEFITDEFDDVICKILCESAKKNNYILYI